MKDINELYSLVSTGSLSEKEALDILVVYISKNPILFGLVGYDEDFRSELILLILEKGEVLFKNYNKMNGSFFTYLYCYIKSSIFVLIKHLDVSKYHEYFDFYEGIETYNENQLSYMKNEVDWIEQNFITYQESIQRNLQQKDEFFSTNETPLEKLKTTSPLLAKKIVLVLILKSSYYITDTQINKLCENFELDKEDILNKVQKLKNSLGDKIDRKHSYEERRNNAYYRRKKYATKIENLKEKNDEISLIKKDAFERKFEKTTKCWKNLNEKLQSGFRNIRPTNKVVANLTGICERQVSYYIKNAKELDINNDEENNNKK
ncbi:MAG: hypothetical protein E7062_09455 [Spirochaetaceae bacterium]|nr:hypothetical protein [Spirochaetaceae bacterium]